MEPCQTVPMILTTDKLKAAKTTNNKRWKLTKRQSFFSRFSSETSTAESDIIYNVYHIYVEILNDLI